jgi:aldose 1-epimerase
MAVGRFREKVARCFFPEGRVLETAIVLFNSRGERVELSPLGAGITSLFVRSRHGRVSDVAVRADGVAGKVIGRYANRIAYGRFAIDGNVYQLATNDDGNHTLHGGPDGFARRTWNAGSVRPDANGHATSVAFTLHSDDGDQGFPGNLSCGVVYTFDDDGRLRISYRATTDASTVINLTNHVYFNLSGGVSPTIANHELQIAATEYIPVDGALIPTGRRAPVRGTTKDFRTIRPIGDEVYDCCFVLDNYAREVRWVAQLHDPLSGRTLDVETTEPGLQLYTGATGAVALETQHFPDSPNHSDFPGTVLRPGQLYESVTVYRFTA